MLAAALCCVALPAQAQDAAPVVEVEATSDARVRGLSWSDGKPTLAASVWAPLGGGVEADARVTALRDSARHGGAEAGVDAALRYVAYTGGWRLSAGLAGHAFPGVRGLHYGEVEARAGYTLGPATVSAGAAYAPRQAAIGGDNLYLSASAQAGVPGTPLTLLAGLGHSSGSGDGRARARRLRPDGSYWDWRVGAEYVRAPFAVGARLTGTSVDDARGRYVDRHTGTQASGYVRVEL